MMKKLQNIAAIFAAGALLLGAASCSHDGGASLAALGKKDDGNKNPPPGGTTPATAATYSFAGGTNGIVAADLDNWDLEEANTIRSPVASTLKSVELNNGATIAWKGSKVGTFRFRATHTASSGDIATLAPTITGLNYNGGAASDLSSGISIGDLDRYVSIDVDGAGTVTAKISFNNSSSNTGTLQAALVDSDGELLGDLVTADVATGKITGTENKEGSVTGTTSSETTVYLVFSRNGAAGGGIDVTEIKVAPAAE